ncbi:MAG: hypothetical protein HQL65_19605 [Magnetococcales bacterium]|nr:hypothetical protein [Magnetococcales bacterium]
MSEQLVTFIVTPVASWLLALFVLVLGLLEWANLIHVRLRNVREQLNLALHLLDSSPEENEAFAGVFRSLSAKWGAIDFYRLTWNAFQGTIVPPAGAGGVRSLVRASTFFTPEHLLPVALPVRRLRLIPFFLVSTGFLLSIIVLLTNLLLSVRGVMPGDGTTIHLLIGHEWRLLPLHLLPALTGLFGAIWFALETRRHLAGLEARISRFARGLETRIHYLPGATLLADHLSQKQETPLVARAELAPDWIDQLAKTLHEALSERDAARQGLLDRSFLEGLNGITRNQEKEQELLHAVSEHMERMAQFFENKWLRVVKETMEPVIQTLGRGDERWTSLLEMLEKGQMRQTEGLERQSQRFGEIQKSNTRELDQSMATAVSTVGTRIQMALQEQMERLVNRSERLAILLEGLQTSLGQMRETLQSGSATQHTELREQWRNMRTMVQNLAVDLQRTMHKQQEKVEPALAQVTATLSELESRQTGNNQTLQATLLDKVTATLRQESDKLADRQARGLERALGDMRSQIENVAPADAEHLASLAEKLERVIVLLAGKGETVNGISLDPVIEWVRGESARMAHRNETVIRSALAELLAAIPGRHTDKDESEQYIQRLETVGRRLEEGVTLLTSSQSRIQDLHTLIQQGNSQAGAANQEELRLLLEGVREDLLDHEKQAAERLTALAGQFERISATVQQVRSEDGQKADNHWHTLREAWQTQADDLRKNIMDEANRLHRVVQVFHATLERMERLERERQTTDADQRQAEVKTLQLMLQNLQEESRQGVEESRLEMRQMVQRLQEEILARLHSGDEMRPAELHLVGEAPPSDLPAGDDSRPGHTDSDGARGPVNQHDNGTEQLLTATLAALEQRIQAMHLHLLQEIDARMTAALPAVHALVQEPEGVDANRLNRMLHDLRTASDQAIQDNRLEIQHMLQGLQEELVRNIQARSAAGQATEQAIREGITQIQDSLQTLTSRPLALHGDAVTVQEGIARIQDSLQTLANRPVTLHGDSVAVQEGITRIQDSLQTLANRPVTLHGDSVAVLVEQLRERPIQVAEDVLLPLTILFQEEVEKSCGMDVEKLQQVLENLRADNSPRGEVDHQEIRRMVQHLQEEILTQMRAGGETSRATEQAILDNIARLERQLLENQTRLLAESNVQITDAVTDAVLDTMQTIARDLGAKVTTELTSELTQELDRQTQTMRGIVSDLGETVTTELQATTLQTPPVRVAEDVLLPLVILFQEEVEKSLVQNQARLQTIVHDLGTQLTTEMNRPVTLQEQSVAHLAEQLRERPVQVGTEAMQPLVTRFQEQMEKSQDRHREEFQKLLASLTQHLTQVFGQGFGTTQKTLTWLRQTLEQKTTTGHRELLEKMTLLAREAEERHAQAEQQRKQSSQEVMEILFQRVSSTMDDRLLPVKSALEEMRQAMSESVALASQELMEKMVNLANIIETVQDNSFGIHAELEALDEPFMQLADSIRDSIQGMEQTRDAVYFFTEKFPELLAVFLEAVEEY